jgi:pyruvate/2-oxoglutarate/acetoin dehydrogenase E1 component
VAALLAAALPERLVAPVRRLGAAPTVIPAAKALEDALLLSSAAIEQAVLELLSA